MNNLRFYLESYVKIMLFYYILRIEASIMAKFNKILVTLDGSIPSDSFTGFLKDII